MYPNSKHIIQINCFKCGNNIIGKIYYCCDSRKYKYCEKCTSFQCKLCNLNPRKIFECCKKCKQTTKLMKCSCSIICLQCQSFSYCLICKQQRKSLQSIIIKPQINQISRCNKCKQIHLICTCKAPKPFQRNQLPPIVIDRQQCTICRKYESINELFCNSFCGHYICGGCWKSNKAICGSIFCENAVIDAESANQFFKVCSECRKNLNEDQLKIGSCSKCTIKIKKAQKNIENQIIKIPADQKKFQPLESIEQSKVIANNKQQNSNKKNIMKQCDICNNLLNSDKLFLNKCNKHIICRGCSLQMRYKKCITCDIQYEKMQQLIFLYKQKNMQEKENIIIDDRKICLKCNMLFFKQKLLAATSNVKICRDCCIKTNK